MSKHIGYQLVNQIILCNSVVSKPLQSMYNKEDLTNLTDNLWQNSDFLFEYPNRNRKHSLKEILRAIIYIDKTGCRWRMLPCEFLKWQLVYYYFPK